MAYQRQLDTFDRERGDVLSFAREDVARLADYWEYSHPILRELFRWFLGADETAVQMADPRDNRELRGLIEHQKRNAARRYDFLLSQQERKRGKTTDDHGQPRTTTDNQVKDKVEVQPKRSVSEALGLDGGVAAPTGDGSPTAAAPSADCVVKARTCVARYAPAPKFALAFDPSTFPRCRSCDDAQRRRCRECGAKGKLAKADCETLRDDSFFVDSRMPPPTPSETVDEFEEKVYRFSKDFFDDKQYGPCARGEGESELYSLIDDDGMKCRDAMEKYRATLGETFDRAVWTFNVEKLSGSLPPTDKDGNPTNLGKLFFGRLNKLTRAQAILAQADAMRQRKDGTK